MTPARQLSLDAARLYGIVDLGYLTADDCVRASLSLLEGGVDVLQLRAKGHERREITQIAYELAPLCRAGNVPFIVNDFVEIAREVGADGVHLGQDDGEIGDARAVLPAGSLVGRSTHTPAQARAALEEGASYIGFGPLFPTPTKEGRPGIGLGDLEEVERAVGAEIPVFCIGGIKAENLNQVLGAGASRVVIVSGLLQAEDIQGACRQVRELLGGQVIGQSAKHRA
ncbi:MAG: thiamine phosphate synthase [Roseibacillus sp.]|nr:thiamine phosphate synthase [Roseibacillus sp.]